MTSPVWDGFQRLRDLIDEMGRIEQKRGLAALHGASELALRDLDGELASLSKQIGEAAVAEARRELDEAMDEARRLEKGRQPQNKGDPAGPHSPTPPRPPPPPDPVPGGGGGGGGAGGAGGGGGGFFGIPPAPGPHGDSNQVPPAECIFVRSADTVWAWSRFDQEWKQQDFSSRLLKVDRIGGGLLAVAEHGAAIYDVSVGRWLPAMHTGETLLEGQGDFASGLPVPPVQPPLTRPISVTPNLPSLIVPVTEPVDGEPPLEFPEAPLTSPGSGSPDDGPGL